VRKAKKKTLWKRFIQNWCEVGGEKK